MAWNEPTGGNGNNNGKKHDDNDPWQRNRTKDSEEDPLGLDQWKSLFKKYINKGGNQDPFSKRKNNQLAALIGIFVVFVLVYIASGFYTVREAERAVVLSLGSFSRVEEPGLHWRFPLLESVKSVDIQMVKPTKSSGSMLTEDENVVYVEMDVQYRISNPQAYLYHVVNPDVSLNQATDSALRYVIGHTNMDDVLTNGREKVRQLTRELLTSIIAQYDMGISVVDVNFLPARAPDEVKAAFDDAISAQEDEQRFKREAEAYKNEVLPKAEGKSQRYLEEAKGYQQQVVARAQGDVAKFDKILPAYRAAPEVTRRRIYLETMENVYGQSTKIILSGKNESKPMLYIPIDKMIEQQQKKQDSGSSNN